MKIKKLAKLVFALALVIGVAALGYSLLNAGQVLSFASAYYAKTLCSGVYLAKRNEHQVILEDVLAERPFVLRHWQREVYRDRKLVNVALSGFAGRNALYRPGLGCTLVTGTSIRALREQVKGYSPPPPAERSTALWPQGDSVELSGSREGVDTQKLETAIDAAFTEPKQGARRRTRSVVVVHKGRIIAERYAEGFGPDTPQAGWSMGKSVLNALIGTLVADGRLRLDLNRLLPQWQGAGDPRSAITVDNLLRMESGLDFDDPHGRMLSDVRKMLFLRGDAASYAASEKLRNPVGSSWFYSSGSSALLASAMRTALGGSQAQYFSYPRKALFGPLGMHSAVMEPDAAGTFLAPAFVYASARDWARLGLLYLNDGVWEGERILPEGWVKTSLKPTSQSGGQYGAHLWLEIPGFLRPETPSVHPPPEDAFFMLGIDGQMVAVIPSLQLVVVRLGL
ncbi:MAG: serine hydrolase, partial [Hyphomicrobiaceae bacterium]|nr:serine hydrolase [Hyphomicrobiaceae bacterium]